MDEFPLGKGQPHRVTTRAATSHQPLSVATARYGRAGVTGAGAIRPGVPFGGTTNRGDIGAPVGAGGAVTTGSTTCTAVGCVSDAGRWPIMAAPTTPPPMAQPT